MVNKRILISGAGIGGGALAWWLEKHGFTPTIIEHAPKLREGGYVIDFFGKGYDVAEKMGLLESLRKDDLLIHEITFINERGEKRGRLDTIGLRKLLNDRAISLLRSDLAKNIYNILPPSVEVMFGKTIIAIAQDEQEVRVTFSDNTSRTFDLLIGADGLHSNVRHLVFGEESQFERFYGYYTSSFTIPNFFGKDDLFLSYNAPSLQTGIYSIRKNQLATFFLFRRDEKLSYDRYDHKQQKQILRDVFTNAGWKNKELLERMDEAPDFYFDPVSQIRMSEWSKGRVSLVGDACDCPSLLSGQGCTLAMVGAYILAGELKAAQGNYRIAFQNYQDIFRPFMDNKQDLARKFAGSFVPKSRFGIFMRNTFTKLMVVPFIAKLFFAPFVSDKITLKDY